MALLNKNTEQKKKKAILRWPIFALGITLLIFALQRGEIKEAILSFAIGAAGGFALDWVGVAKLKLWLYTKQKFLSKPYFGVVIQTWGILGMATNLIWNWAHMPEIVVFFCITLGLFALHEIPNLKTESWRYSVPMWIVIPGWLPLILAFRAVYLLLSQLV